MPILSYLRNSYQAWQHDTPLPSDADANFQSWHEYDITQRKWTPVVPPPPTNDDAPSPSLRLVTWNIDAFAPSLPDRTAAILSRIRQLDPAVSVIFLQELARTALPLLLDDPHIRKGWYVSEADNTSWRGQSFASATLLSKAHFDGRLGPVWRCDLPSRFGRDALCADVFAGPRERVRLVNVHLDSLAVNPSRRPRQMAIVAALLRSAGRGLVAGDFNPVLPEDAVLAQENGLVDAWVTLRNHEDGYTWGVDGEQPFPPNRMDRVAVLGLEPRTIEVLHPGSIATDAETVPWSDHSGLVASFALS